MYRTAILTIVSKSDENGKDIVLTSWKLAKIRYPPPLNRIKSPNHDKNEWASSFL